MIQVFSCFIVQQVVVNKISSSNYFNIINIVGINCWKTDSTIIHLSCKNFISKEIISKQSTIRICKIMRICSSYIWQISKKWMQWVILFMDIIEMLSILINSVWSKHIFKKQKGIIILMLDWRCVIKYSYIWIVHFIISNHEQSWNVNWSVCI